MDLDLQPDNPWDGRSLVAQSGHLSAYASVCRRLGATLMIRGEVPAARLWAAQALRAEELLAHGFAQPDLDALRGDFPQVPAWLDPDEVAREPWQDEAARVRALARDAADALRA